MHIVYIHYLCEGDTALNHVRQFADAARQLGHLVDTYAMNLAPSAEVTELAKPSKQLLSSRIRQALKQRWGRYLHEPKELWWNTRYTRIETELLRGNRPDVLLVRDHLLTCSCVPVARRLDLPLVLEVNAPAAESGLYLDEYFHLPLVANWTGSYKLRNADAVTVVSEALKSFLVATHAISAGKIVSNPNGADLQKFREDSPVDSQIVSFCEGVPVVGFIGSFEKWHGIDLLAKMAVRVGETRPSARFLFVGDGPEQARARLGTETLGPRVLFSGMVDHERIPGLVASLDIGVMPESNFYGSPLKVVEWMASGLATVAPSYGPLEEIIDDGVHGLLFEPKNLDALVAAVVRLIDDPDLRQKLGQAAAKRAHSSLGWHHNAERVLQVCERVLEGRLAQ